MRGISINGIHTAKDLHFVMTMQKIETPTVKTYKTDVPGRNGSLDLSEFLTGDIQYNNRQLNFKFLANGNRIVYFATVLLLFINDTSVFPCICHLQKKTLQFMA